MVAWALLLTTIRATAPMPAVLPAYSVICSAGEMSGVRARFRLRILGQGDERRGELRIDDSTVPVSVRAHPITLFDSIGGTGFVDMLQYEYGGLRGYIRLAVRGELGDDLIMVHLYRQPVAGPAEPAHHLSGACHTTAGSSRHQERRR